MSPYRRAAVVYDVEPDPFPAKKRKDLLRMVTTMARVVWRAKALVKASRRAAAARETFPNSTLSAKLEERVLDSYVRLEEAVEALE